MPRSVLIWSIILSAGVSITSTAWADEVSDYVALKVSSSCQENIGAIDISITPLGNTQIPGPPGITILQSKDTGVKWQTAMPFFIESPLDYFPEPPNARLTYTPGQQEMPMLIADFAYCPTKEECLFATEQIEVQNLCH